MIELNQEEWQRIIQVREVRQRARGRVLAIGEGRRTILELFDALSHIYPHLTPLARSGALYDPSILKWKPSDE